MFGGYLGGCNITAESCVDGHTYEARCMDGGDDLTCECFRDGALVMTATELGGALACASSHLSELCGFPVQ